ncbi:hypothetical protein EW145_g1212 [Phellinidium pouzarii]|uniref:Uncharacterized protein n=1 Tax=Phellinidium pouzarii TaxID=167371 RepID=A0A4S4LH77_9AGAM|nr:hypothetical protein EW145_g1212 [Phellinidium pouzarii]
MPQIESKQTITATYICYAFIAQILASWGLIISILAPVVIKHPLPEYVETKASRYRLLTPRTSPPKPPVKTTSTIPALQKPMSMPRRNTFHDILPSPSRTLGAQHHVHKARRATISTLRSFSSPARPPFIKAMTRLQPTADSGTEDVSSSKDPDKDAAPLLQRAASVVAPIQRARKAVRRSFSLAQAPIFFEDAPSVSETTISEEPDSDQPPSSAPNDDQFASTPTQNDDAPCFFSPTTDSTRKTPLTLLKVARTRTQTALRNTASSVARVSTLRVTKT